ncbi:MAG: hypothetical protein ABF665_10120, partial [Gluconacetobacter sp.]
HECGAIPQPTGGPGRAGGGAAVALLAGTGFFLMHKPAPTPDRPAQTEATPAPAMRAEEHPAPERLAARSPEVQPAPATAPGAAPVAAPGATPVPGAAPPKPAVVVAPAPVPAPIPVAVPQQAELPPLPEQAGAGVPDNLLDTVVTVRPENRANALGNSLAGTDQQLSWVQAARVLRGSADYARVELIGVIAKHVATPIPVQAVLNYLQFTGNARPRALVIFDPLLPDDISPADAASLLTGIGQGDRRDSMTHVINHVQASLTADQALALLHNTDNFWVGALDLLKSKLVTPQSGSDIVRLLGRTADGSRHDAIQELSGAMPDTLAPADAVRILNGLGNFRTSGIQLIATHLPDGLSVADVQSLLNGLSGGSRHDAISAVAHHIKPGQAGADLAPVLKQTDHFQSDAIVFLRPALAPEQSVASILALLGTLSSGERQDAINTLKSYLPNGLTPADAQAILRGTDNFYASSLGLIAPRLAPMSAADAAQLTSPIAGTMDGAMWLKKLSRRG